MSANKVTGNSSFEKKKFAPSNSADQQGKKRKREEKPYSFNLFPTNGVKVARETPRANGYHKTGPASAQGKPKSYNNAKSKSPVAEKSQALLKARAQLPIWSHSTEIRHGLSQSQNVMILVGETGSGKSTQVPQFLLSEPWCKEGCIAVTQPRRVAAISLARRVAEEMGTPLGNASPASKVGYSVRFDNNAAKGTRIKYLTEGMLVQEMLRDPWLKGYAAVVVDEVHERGVNVDLIMGFLRRIVTSGDEAKRRRGRDLKVVVMSATADVEKIFRFFEEGFSRAEESSKLLENGNTAAGKQEDAESEASWSGFESSEESSRVGKEKEFEPTMSKTVKEVYSDHISTCNIEGRQYPVEVLYLPEPTTDIVEAALKTIFQIHYKEPLPGDILVFMTGQDVVEALETLVNEHAAAMVTDVPKVSFLFKLKYTYIFPTTHLSQILTLPLFAALPQAAQQLVFQPTPPRTRKIIIATNIAETSLTIPGIRHVIDTGFAKIKEFRAALSLDSLLVKPISQSSAIQRKGRAGRESAGKCYRLYTEKDYLALAPATIPEILRCDLASALLTMKARGVDDVINFPFLDPPKPEAMRKALLQLHRLGALTDTGKISPTGSQMARLPLVPPLARILIAAAQPDRDCVLDVVDIISCLTVESIFLPLMSDDKKEEAESARNELYRREGDHLTLMATLQAYARENSDRKAWADRHFVSHRAMRSVMDVRKQLRLQCQQLTLLPSTLDLSLESVEDTSSSLSSAERTDAILRTILVGFAQNVARLCPDGSYKTVEGNQTVGIHPSSVMRGRKLEAIVYNELVWTTRCWARGVSAVRMDWWGAAVEAQGEQ